MAIDINCDMGEGFGAYAIADDALLAPWISAANIACGFHAGDASVMRRTVRLCLERGVAVGAHPGLPDLQGFGRRMMAVSFNEVYEFVLYQIGALQAITRAEGGRLHHVKPHGALYHMAEHEEMVANAIVQAVIKASDESLVLYALSNGRLAAEGERQGLRVRHEAFADRAYRRDGSLLPRNEFGAVLNRTQAVVDQVLRLVQEGQVMTAEGERIPVNAHTICIHSDGPNAPEHAQAIYEALHQQGIKIGGGSDA
jgi:UPF0271 protein